MSTKPAPADTPEPRRYPPEQVRQIRAWARASDIPVSSAGPLPVDVVTAWEHRHVEELIPDERHHAAAERLVRASRRHGAVAVLAMVEDMLRDDVPLVMVALARRAWAGGAT